MARLGRWCFEHRKRVAAAWLLAIVVIVGVSVAVGSSFNSNNALPGTDSQAAATLLTQNFPAASGEGDQVVIQATHGTTIKSAPVQSAVSAALAKVAKVPGIESVASPYASNGAAQVSRDGTIAFARVTWDKPSTQVTPADARNLIGAAESADGPDVRVSLGGQSIETSERPSIGISVVVAVAAALVILLIVFGGALLSSLMPLLTAGLALVIATSLIELLSHAFDVASVSSELAVLIGLGVGVDYGLFIISRHRSAVKDGLPYSDAAALAVRTSGRTVLLAGLTVCIALLGQFALGVSFLYGPSLGAAIAVALTMAASLTFLPAMLGFLGPRVLSRRERARVASGEAHTDTGGFWLGWARVIQARKALVAAGALAAVVVIALPILGLRLGTSDASTDPAGSTTHQAYTALAQGFGPGFNGPLELVAQAGSPVDTTAFGNLLATAARTPGVASVTAAQTSPNGKVMLATVYPTTSPQASQTISLVDDLRDNLIPQAEHGTSLAVHVGGVTATNIDFSHVLTDKLPIFIAIVVLLAFLLLMTVFRSLLIPLTASVMNLLSVGAALGALNAVFNWGWGSSLLRLSGTGPIDAFIPVLLFSVLFGLSMDYEVYLVSRIQEEWHQLHHTTGDIALPAPGDGAARHDHLAEWDHLHHNTKDIQLAALSGRAARRNHLAVTTGQAKSGEIIAAAATIMILVFGSFLLGGQRVLQEFGFGLGFAVLVDAFVIRSLLVPALMHLIGPANWALPGWLDRLLPRVAVEAAEQGAAAGPEAGLDPAETR
jgi:RND superfamily putative drug exporter